MVDCIQKVEEAMQVGDLVRVEDIGAGIVTATYWDSEEGEYAIRIQYTDGTWSLESESIVEVISGV